MAFLPCMLGSVQRPHQKTQSAQCKTPSENVPEEKVVLAFTLET
jgi:hypothetical protein